MDLSPISLESVLNKAQLSFWDCLRNEENAFLKDEVDFPIELIAIKKDYIKIYFDRPEDDCLLEVLLNLVAPSNEKIGSYIYKEDGTGKVVDDYLIFQ